MQDFKKQILLASLSNTELARLIMRRLWNRYDLGGVSMRRSLRASLLESIIDLLPLPEDDIELDEWDLIKEADKRPFQKSEQHQFEFSLFISKTHLLPLDALVCLVIFELKQWYENDRKNNAMTWIIGDTKIVDALFRLMGTPDKIVQFKVQNISFSNEDLMSEGKERTRRLTEKHYRETVCFYN